MELFFLPEFSLFSLLTIQSKQLKYSLQKTNKSISKSTNHCFRSMVLTWMWFCFLGDIWQSLETFLVFLTRGSVLMTAGRQRPRALPHILQCTEQILTKRIIWPQNVCASFTFWFHFVLQDCESFSLMALFAFSVQFPKTESTFLFICFFPSLSRTASLNFMSVFTFFPVFSIFIARNFSIFLHLRWIFSFWDPFQLNLFFCLLCRFSGNPPQVSAKAYDGKAIDTILL